MSTPNKLERPSLKNLTFGVQSWCLPKWSPVLSPVVLFPKILDKPEKMSRTNALVYFSSRRRAKKIIALHQMANLQLKNPKIYFQPFYMVWF
jgi:hypothetical protein